MARVAVVAHRKKHLAGEGLGELRTALADEGVTDPLWYEVPKSKKAPKRARAAVKEGADLVLVWGGDGTVQRCLDALAGSGAAVGILPAGTANLLASSLRVPVDLSCALRLALHGERRVLDPGVVNDERFAVMAGTGFDALMMSEVDRALKDRLGRLAYLWTGAKAMRANRVRARVRVDGKVWFDGATSCVLLGNVGTITGGLVVFEKARPDDGRLEVGVVTARGVSDWLRVFARLLRRQARRSPLVRTTGGERVEVVLDRPMPYELDGGDRKPTRRLEAKVEPAAVRVCVPPRQGPA